MKCPNCDGKLTIKSYKKVTYVYSNVHKQYATLECEDCDHTEVFN